MRLALGPKIAGKARSARQGTEQSSGSLPLGHRAGVLKTGNVRRAFRSPSEKTVSINGFSDFLLRCFWMTKINTELFVMKRRSGLPGYSGDLCRYAPAGRGMAARAASGEQRRKMPVDFLGR